MVKAVDHLKRHRYGRLFFPPLMYKTKVGGKLEAEVGHKEEREKKQNYS